MELATRIGRTTAALVALALLAAACATDEPADDGDEPADEEPSDESDEEPEAEPAEPVTLSYAFFAPAVTFPAQQMEQWAERVEERTDGLVQVETFPGATLLDAPGMYDGVLEGVADIGLGSPGYDTGRFPLLSGVALPVGFPDATVASLTLWDLIQEYQPAAITDDFKVLTAFTTEPGHLMTNFRVTSLEDLEGRDLRAAGSGVPVLQALGANPVAMPMPEVPEAVATGVIDGLMTSREVLQDFGLAEDLGYVVNNYPMGVTTFAAVMTREQWESLPAEVQEVMDELGREMAEWTGNYHDTQNVESALAWGQEEHGLELVELSDDEMARWDEVLAPVVDEWIAEVSGAGFPAEEFLDRLYELRDQ